MNEKIIGVTVGTAMSPSKIENEIKPVKTVNGKTPDENGNIEVNTEEWTFTLKEGGKVKKTICVTKSEEIKKETKTFTIVYSDHPNLAVGTQFEYEDGMTWGEWANSSYNTDVFYANEHYVYYDDSHYMCDADDNCMIDSHLITSPGYKCYSLK